MNRFTLAEFLLRVGLPTLTNVPTQKVPQTTGITQSPSEVYPMDISAKRVHDFDDFIDILSLIESVLIDSRLRAKQN